MALLISSAFDCEDMAASNLGSHLIWWWPVDGMSFLPPSCETKISTGPFPWPFPWPLPIDHAVKDYPGCLEHHQVKGHGCIWSRHEGVRWETRRKSHHTETPKKTGRFFVSFGIWKSQLKFLFFLNCNCSWEFWKTFCAVFLVYVVVGFAMLWVSSLWVEVVFSSLELEKELSRVESLGREASYEPRYHRIVSWFQTVEALTSRSSVVRCTSKFVLRHGVMRCMMPPWRMGAGRSFWKLKV